MFYFVNLAAYLRTVLPVNALLQFPEAEAFYSQFLGFGTSNEALGPGDLYHVSHKYYPLTRNFINGFTPLAGYHFSLLQVSQPFHGGMNHVVGVGRSQ